MKAAASASRRRHELKRVDQLQIDAAHDQLAVAEREPDQHRLGLGGRLHQSVEILDHTMLTRDDPTLGHGVSVIVGATTAGLLELLSNSMTSARTTFGRDSTSA